MNQRIQEPGLGHSLPITDHQGLQRALREANLPSLLMVYVQLTGDEAMLDTFAPHLQSIYSTEVVEVPEELAADLRQRLFTLLTAEMPVSEPPLSTDFVRHMMSVSVGEAVDPELVPVLYDQMGFERPVPRKEQPGRPQPPADFRVLVIGGGMSGIAAGVKLGEAGYNYVIAEKNSELGGTWWENRYPGVGLDTPSHFYAYSFAQSPDWSHYHPKGAEIERYLLNVAGQYGVRERVQFNTRVRALRWDEDASLWHVRLESQGEVREESFNAVINGHGILNRWRMPDIPGLEDFRGVAMHTAGWDPEVDLKGKRVAIIGTGASGAQLAVAIAPEAAQLTVFQRSKHWVMNNPEIHLGVTEGVKFALRHIPHYMEWFRFRVYWFTGDGLYGNVLRDPTWEDQSLSISAQNDGARQYALAYMQRKFADRPDLLEKMQPDYPIFGKRIVLDADGGWLDTLKQPNVSLETAGIERIVENGILTRDGRLVEVDVIALATGFELAPALGSMQVFGRGGVEAGAVWGRDEARSYLGIMVPGYPNFFMTQGPNSAPNHAAGVNMVIESQVNYIIEALDLLVAWGAKALEPTEAAYREWNERVDSQMQNMVWLHPKASSYYLNSKGRNWVSCPFRLADYWSMVREPDPEALVLK